jgi:hypothetical protein
MADLRSAPDNDATLPQDTPAGTAVDASQKPTLSKLWDNWTSRPENNAAMINFGLNLMQPKYPGETGLSHFANAIGAGAEASSRNIGEQEARAKTEEEEGLKEQEAARKERETNIYGESVKSLAESRAGKGGVKDIQAKNKAYATAAAGFNKWLDDDVDMGSYWQHIQQKYGVKKKSDIQNNPELKKKVAQEYMQDHLAEAMTQSGYYDRGGGDEGGGEGAFVPPPGAVIRYQGNKPIYFNPTTKQPYPGQE